MKPVVLILTTIVVTGSVMSTPTGRTLWGVSFTNELVGIAVGDAGTIIRTTDGGTSWTAQSSGTRNHLYGVSIIGATGTTVGQSGTILRTTNSGAKWTSQNSGTTKNLRGVFFRDANTGTVVGDGGTLLRTADGGATWIMQPIGTTNRLNGVFFPTASVGTIVGWGYGTILQTIDGGVNWIGRVSGGEYVALYGVFFSDIANGWTVGHRTVGGQTMARVLHTTDGGQSWWDQETGISPWFLDGVSFASTENGIAVGAYGTIIYTTNGGTNWVVPIGGSGTTRFLTSVTFTTATKAVAVGESGTVLLTTDAGATWREPKRGGKKVREAEDLSPMADVASHFALEQNYPNPFNPTTTISYAIPVDADVSLGVYNMLGQKVAQLIDERMEAGYHDVTFDASGLSSGVYFYCLQAGKLTTTRKVVVMK